MKIRTFFTVLILTLSLAVHASYDFNVSNPQIVGTFSGTKTVPLTLACWIKYANHPESNDWAFTLHKDANNDELVSLESSATADRLDARQYNSSGSDAAFHTSSTGEYDGVWVPWVGTFESTSVWNVFVELITNTNERSASRDPGPIDQITIGTSPAGTADWITLIAECAIWDGELIDPDAALYMNGTCAKNIDNANLIGYWSLDHNDSTPNDESGNSGPTLTVTNATFNADHPAISCGVVPITVTHRRRRIS